MASEFWLYNFDSNLAIFTSNTSAHEMNDICNLILNRMVTVSQPNSLADAWDGVPLDDKIIHVFAHYCYFVFIHKLYIIDSDDGGGLMFLSLAYQRYYPAV